MSREKSVIKTKISIENFSNKLIELYLEELRCEMIFYHETLVLVEVFFKHRIDNQRKILKKKEFKFLKKVFQNALNFVDYPPLEDALESEEEEEACLLGPSTGFDMVYEDFLIWYQIIKRSFIESIKAMKILYDKEDFTKFCKEFLHSKEYTESVEIFYYFVLHTVKQNFQNLLKI